MPAPLEWDLLVLMPAYPTLDHRQPPAHLLLVLFALGTNLGIRHIVGGHGYPNTE